MKKLIIAAALLSVSGLALAGNSNGCQGNCPSTGSGVGDITNTASGGAGGAGYGGTGIGVGIGQGGNGGAGGQGGAGGIGIGQGGSVLGSGNSANTNRNTNLNANSNRNTNKQGQAQGQAQGQLQGQQQRATAKQGQSQSSRNKNDNRSSASNTNSNANSGNNSAQSVNVGGDTYEAARIPVATAYAAPLAASNGTCMGSTSAGAQGVGFGISIGSTWNDKSCDMRYDAEALRQAGMPQAAVARLCQKAEIATAMEAAGTPCPSSKPKHVAIASAQRAPTAAEKTAQYSGNDPIVRKRLGLPPLK